jgi:uncharacterized beta barrel domain-containing protein DUF5777
VSTRSCCARVLLFGLLSACVVAPAYAQTPDEDDDARLRPAEPDFVVINLPTTLPLPVHGGNFHLTHRFNENLRNDPFSDQLGNVFGLDNGANIGLEFRFGVFRHLEAVVQRTSISKTIQFSAKYDGWHQTEAHPVALSAIVSVEGDNNFRQSYAPALGVVVSRTVADRLALYATPIWVHNTGTGNVDGNTGYLGLGARLRVAETAYLVGEVSPRIGGYVIGDPEYAFAIEKRVGAHVFALTFANGASTTFRQLAHGGVPGGLYLGFNLTRKFF